VRLLGIYASGFGAPQLGLFKAPPARADRVRDVLEKRFGEGAVTRASQLPKPGPRRGPING
jgi:hypothetical protein